MAKGVIRHSPTVWEDSAWFQSFQRTKRFKFCTEVCTALCHSVKQFAHRKEQVGMEQSLYTFNRTFPAYAHEWPTTAVQNMQTQWIVK